MAIMTPCFGTFAISSDFAQIRHRGSVVARESRNAAKQSNL